MSEPEHVEFLTEEDLLALIEAELGTRHIVADYGLLQSAVTRPQGLLFGETVYPGLAGKAAALLHSLVTTHPLVDGNKRIGVAAALLFYGLNGVRLAATDDELYDLIMEVADGTQRDVEAIAKCLARWEEPLDFGRGGIVLE